MDYLENRLEGSVNVRCESDTFANNLQLYVVVMEREVTAYTGGNQDTMFRNVVLDMLPTPAGKLLGNGWSRGEEELREFSWDYAGYVEDVEDLSVVAFIQDRDAGGILHADQKPHTPGVGLKNQLATPVLRVYPNPASHTLYVNLGKSHPITGELRILNLSGQEELVQPLETGRTKQRLDISHLPEGIYMIGWMQAGKLVQRTKWVLTR